MAVNYIPFETEHGFASPGFAVDAEGNVTVKSLTYSVVEEAIVGVEKIDESISSTPQLWKKVD